MTQVMKVKKTETWSFIYKLYYSQKVILKLHYS